MPEGLRKTPLVLSLSIHTVLDGSPVIVKGRRGLIELDPTRHCSASERYSFCQTLQFWLLGRGITIPGGGVEHTRLCSLSNCFQLVFCFIELNVTSVTHIELQSL